MQLPPESAAWSQCLRYGIYVYRRVLALGQEELAASVKAASLSLRDLGRSWEDSDIGVQEATADRDAAAGALRTLAREARRTLLARADQAEKTAPYTLIFPRGLGEYTGCGVEEVQACFKQLRERLIANLSAEDPLRADLVPRLEAALSAHAGAEAGLEDARNLTQRARDLLLNARSEWDALLEKGYGTLISLYGKEETEDFFPSQRRGKESSEETAGG